MDLASILRKVEGLTQATDRLEQENVKFKQEISGLKQDIVGLKQEIVGLKQEIVGLQQEIVELKEDRDRHQSGADELRKLNELILKRVANLEEKKGFQAISEHSVEWATVVCQNHLQS
jgi:chromosome segregation ATPase